MWWLDDGTSAEVHPQGQRSNPPEQDLPGDQRTIRLLAEITGSASQVCGVDPADACVEPAPEPSQRQAADEAIELSRQLDAATARRVAAETQLAEAGLQHAEQLAALQLQIQTLEESVTKSQATCNELAATIDQRDATHTAQLVESEQARESAIVRADELTVQLIARREEAVTLQSRLDTEIKERAAAAAQREEEFSLALVEARQAQETVEQRANQLAADLAAMDAERAALQVNLETELQQHLTAVDAWRELERQHVSQTESLQSELVTLQALVHEHEAARLESNSALTRSNEEHVAELGKLDEARQAAAQRNEELEGRVRSLQDQLESSSARADKESESRAAAASELQRLTEEFRQLSDQAETTRGEFAALQRRSAAQHAEQIASLETQAVELRTQSELAAAQREEEFSLALLEAGQAQEAIQQRANQLATDLAAMDAERAALQVNLETEVQEHLTAVDTWRELERQHVSQTESLQSKLLTLEALVQEHEAARLEADSELTRSNEEHAAELAKSEKVRQTAEQRNEELESSLARADKESESRAAVESELQRLTEECRQLSDQAETTRGEFAAAAAQREEEFSLALIEARQAGEGVEQRANQLAADLAAMDAKQAALQVNLETEVQEHLTAVDTWRELERQHVSQTDSLQSKLLTLEALLHENEAARLESNSALTRSNEEHVAELGKLDEARQAAAQRNEELEGRVRSLQDQLESSSVRADKESESRAAAESELQRLTEEFRQLSDQAETTRGEFAALQRDSAEQLQKLAAGTARLRRDLDDCERELRERDEHITRQTAELAHRREGARSIQLEKEQLAAQHAEQIASLETQAAELRAQVEAERASRMRIQQALDTHEASLREFELAAAQREEEFSLALLEARQAQETVEQRANQLATDLAAMDAERAALQVNLETEVQQHLTAVDAWRELERQHVSQTESLQSELVTLQALVREHEAARLESNSALTRSNEEHVAELGKLDEARQAAAQRNRELEGRVRSLQDQLGSSSARADKESESRAAAESELQRLTEEFRQLSDQAETTRGEFAALQRHSAEQLQHLAAGTARLRQELDDRERQLAEENQRKQQLQEVIQRNTDAHESRQQAESLADSLTQEVARLRKRVDAFRGLAQRQAAARKKLEAAIKRSDESADNGAFNVAIRAKLEVNERIRRLTTELTATRNQELSVRQRAMKEIKRAQDEVQRLQDQLAKAEKAA